MSSASNQHFKNGGKIKHLNFALHSDARYRPLPYTFPIRVNTAFYSQSFKSMGCRKRWFQAHITILQFSEKMMSYAYGEHFSNFFFAQNVRNGILEDVTKFRFFTKLHGTVNRSKSNPIDVRSFYKRWARSRTISDRKIRLDTIIFNPLTPKIAQEACAK